MQGYYCKFKYRNVWKTLKINQSNPVSQYDAGASFWCNCSTQLFDVIQHHHCKYQICYLHNERSLSSLPTPYSSSKSSSSGNAFQLDLVFFRAADTIQDGCLIFKQMWKKKRHQYCVLIIKTSRRSIRGTRRRKTTNK